jgi:hypothetical protein
MEWFGGCRGIGWSALEGEPWHLGWGWGWGWEVGVVYRTSFLSVSVQKPCLSSLSMQWSQWFPSCRYSLCNLTETAFYTCHTFSLAPCPVFLLPCSIRSRHVHLGTVSRVSLIVLYQIKTRPSWHRVQCFSYRALSDNRLKWTPSWGLIGWSRTSPRFLSPEIYWHICIVPAVVLDLRYYESSPRLVTRFVKIHFISILWSTIWSFEWALPPWFAEAVTNTFGMKIKPD